MPYGWGPHQSETETPRYVPGVTCPLCGSGVTYVGANTVDCVLWTCANFPKPPASDPPPPAPEPEEPIEEVVVG